MESGVIKCGFMTNYRHMFIIYVITCYCFSNNYGIHFAVHSELLINNTWAFITQINREKTNFELWVFTMLSLIQWTHKHVVGSQVEVRISCCQSDFMKSGILFKLLLTLLSIWYWICSLGLGNFELWYFEMPQYLTPILVAHV